MLDDLEIITVETRAHERLLEAFHAGLYLDAFAHQREPLEVWKARLWGDRPPAYDLTIRIAGRELAGPYAEIVGGIVFERYRASRAGLITYLVVSPSAQRGGLGRRLLEDAVRTLHREVPHVFGEVAPDRVDRFVRWGAQVLDVPYVQPSLGPGLPRNPDLRLIVFGAAPPREAVDAFVRELYELTEGSAP